MSEAVRIRRVGVSMFVIDTPGGSRLLLDPWFGGNPTLVPDVDTDEHLASVDAVLCSHGHLDHAEGLARIRSVNAEAAIFTTWELGNLLLREGFANVYPVNYGGRGELADAVFHFVPAAHESSYFAGDVYSGLAAGVVITFENGYRLYYSGDTGLTAEFSVVGDYWQPDLAIVPVGGGIVTMDPDQAAYAVGAMLRVPRVIPCHWFPQPADAPSPEAMEAFLAAAPIVATLTGDRGREFATRVAERYPDVRVDVLELGESVEVDVTAARRAATYAGG
jgi:L-ascorbate metabolism protein UlaG (beta-lactamase superfamily)